VEQLLKDPKPIVRTHLVKALGERRDWSTRDGLDPRAAILAIVAQERQGHVLRAAVEALASHPDRANIEPLLALWKKSPAEDTHLIHATRIALRNNLRDLGSIDAIALSLGESQEMDDRLADVCLGIPNAESARFLTRYLQRPTFDFPREQEYVHLVARYGSPEDVARVIERGTALAGSDVGRQASILRALFNGTQERGQPAPAAVVAWGEKLVGPLLANEASPAVRQGIELARDLRLASVRDTLAMLGGKEARHADCRSAALAALAQIDPGQASQVLLRIVQDSSDAVDVRSPAAELLGKTNHTDGPPILVQLLSVATGNLAVFTARGLSWSDLGADTLLSAMETGKAPAELLNDPVVSHELRFRQAPRKDERIDALKKTIPTPDEAVRTLMAARLDLCRQQPGSVARGQEVFQKNCGICHQLAGQGAKIGPQLDGVGIRGLERLLEDTLDPDRNVDQAFRKKTFVMNDGSVMAGLVLRREGAVIILADAQGKEVRVSANDLEEEQESKLSPMPSDVARGLPPADFQDLMAYLLAQRAPNP
jgi:putative heme-binding domain-containing protein